MLYEYMVMVYHTCFGVLSRVLGTEPYYILVVVISLSSVFCLCRYFLYFFIVGAIGSSSSITSFSASAICSVDFANKTLLVGSVNPLGGGGSGIPWSDGLVVTKDAGTHVTSSCCVFVADGWVRLCVTVETGGLYKRQNLSTCFFIQLWVLEVIPQ